MSKLRVASLPIDHVIAEMTAFPLASEAAFRLGITHLPRNLKLRTDELWRTAEQELGRACPSFSLDELIEIRDRAWFHCTAPEQPGESLAAYLARIADRHLEAQGSAIRPRVRASETGLTDAPTGSAPQAQARQIWRWLSFALPPDLLAAALPGNHAGSDRPTLISPVLERMLADRGFAEIHLHVNAGISFPTLWTATLRRVAETGCREDAFQSSGAVFDEGRDLGAWLLRAAVARYLLAAYLAARQTGTDAASFLEFLSGTARFRLRQSLPFTWLTILDVALQELAAGSFSAFRPSFAEVRAVYAALTGVMAQRFPAAKDQIAATDPVAVCFASIGKGVENAEVTLVAEALKYLTENPQDRPFAVTFWQAVRVRALYYRHIVQRPMTPGLQWFVRTYARISAGRKPLRERTIIECAAETCGLGQGLRSLEVRTSPDDQSALLRAVDTYDQTFAALATSTGPNSNVANGAAAAKSNAAAAEFGVVFHFPKIRGKDAMAGKPQAGWQGSHASPKKNANGYRYGNYYGQRRQEALGLARLLLNFPRSLEVARGVDVCTDELGVPTWVLRPLYGYVCRVSERVSAHLRRSTKGAAVPPFRCTAHAGEDFVHLLGGLRRVSECMVHFGMREGDRIGHGVALGVNAAEWAKRAGRLAVAKEERLFDLIWEWDGYTRQGVACPDGRLPRIEREITDLSREIFEDRTLTPYEMADLIQDLHDDTQLRAVGFPHGRPHVTNDPRRARLLSYLTDPGLFRRGRESLWIDPSPEGPALVSLQATLRHRVAALGLTVEINPSSNLLIGNLGELQEHPLWRLRPPKPGSEERPIAVCIGSDDPLTFAADLPSEYMLLHDALVFNGLSSDEADRWLDEVRQAGLRTRFTIPRLQPTHVRQATLRVSEQGLRPPP